MVRFGLHIILGVVLALSASERGALAQDVQNGGSERSGEVIWLRLENEAITPVTARVIGRALHDGRDVGAVCVVIELDTPGGLMESTKEIVMAVLESPVPVVVYVAPAGARAASAGVFITLAAHVAVMAPATRIGAAHPVSVGGSPLGPATPQDTTAARQQSTMEEKVVNDAVAWVRSLAELRGRNAAWAEEAVRESASITAAEALDLQVIDFIADDAKTLLARLDGRTAVLQGDTVRIATAGAEVRTIEMWWGERLLTVVANPNIAFLLLMFGFYGILFEFYSPGWGVSGTLGAICLVLAFFGLAVLPVNYAGLALIALAIGLFVAEAFFPSFGALTLGGAVCLILGGVMLIDSPIGVMRVSMDVVLPVAVATALITFFLMSRVYKAHRSKVQTGTEAMQEEVVLAVESFVAEQEQYRGMVRVHGELWEAVSPGPVAVGTRLKVAHRRGLTLEVRRITEGRD